MSQSFLGRRTSKTSRLLLLFFMVLVSVLSFSSIAFAKATTPTLSYANLMTKLSEAPGYTLDAYFLTVMQGSTVETITASIEGYAPGGNWRDSLILFRATDQRVLDQGGIAAGMSGSPLYLADTNELVGAVAYGDIFTTQGYGLATPIEAMEHAHSLATGGTGLVESGGRHTVAALGAAPLSLTIPSGDADFTEVILTAEPEKLADQADGDTLIMAPLNRLIIGGIRPNTKSARRVESFFAKRGVPVVLNSLATGSGSGNAAKYPLEAGSAVFTLDSIGSVWMGSLGTLTYHDGKTAMLFGHSGGALQSDIDQYFANAWVSGIWPSTLTSYKMGSPAAIRGKTSYDSVYGLAAEIGKQTPQVELKATLKNTVNGQTASGTSYIPQSLLATASGDDSASQGVFLVWMILSTTGDQMLNYTYQKGSATVATTIVVNDGTRDHTIKLNNKVYSADDIAWEVPLDAVSALSELSAVNNWGIESLVVKKVHVDAQINTKPTESTIVGIEAPRGIRNGTTPVNIKMFQRGRKDPVVISTSIAVPQSTNANSALLQLGAAGSANSDYSWDSWLEYFMGDGDDPSDSNAGPDTPFVRPTIAGIIADINASAPTGNNVDLVLGRMGENPRVIKARGIVASGDVIFGSAIAKNTRVTLTAPKVVNFCKKAVVRGEFEGPKSTEVRVYGTPAGTKKEVLLARRKVSATDRLNKRLIAEARQVDEVLSTLSYSIALPALRRNTRVRVVTAGTTQFLTGTSVARSIRVRTRTSLKASTNRVRPGRSVTLTATNRGTSLRGGRVIFEYRSGRSWKRIKSVNVGRDTASLTTRARWKVPKKPGTYKVRVRFTGNAHHAQTIARRSIRVR